MNTREAILVLLIFVSCGGKARAQGTLVFNGGFATNINGWIVANGAEFEFTKGNPAGDVALGSVLPSNTTDPTASQTINSLTPGAAYLVSGDFRYLTDRGGGSPTDFGFGVMIDGAVLFESAQRTSVVWQHFSFLYSATAPSALLSLAAQRNGTGVEYAIDNIAMGEAPEPSSFWLICAAGISAALFSRCRAATRRPAER
jgi:hypothetical protein